MNTNILVIIMAFFGMLPVSKLIAGDSYPLTGSFTTILNSAYMGKICAVFYRGPTTVNYLDVNFGDHWTLELWSSTGLGKEKYGSTYADEFDIFLNYHRRFSDFKFSLTAAYFFLKDLNDLQSDMWIVDGEVSYAKYDYFQPYVNVRYFGQVSDKSFERGWFVWAGIRGSYPTPLKQVKLTLDASVAYSDGALGKDAGLVYGRTVIGLPVALSKRVSFTPSILLQAPLGNQRNSFLRYTDRNEAIVSAALSVSF